MVSFLSWATARCSRVGAVLTLSLCVCCGTVQAVPIPFGSRAVDITAIDRPLAGFLKELFGTLGLQASVSPSVTGTVNGHFTGSAEKVYRGAAGTYGLVEDYDGSVVRIYSARDAAARKLPAGASTSPAPTSAGTAHATGLAIASSTPAPVPAPTSAAAPVPASTPAALPTPAPTPATSRAHGRQAAAAAATSAAASASASAPGADAPQPLGVLHLQDRRGRRPGYARGESYQVEVEVPRSGFLYCYLIDVHKRLDQFFPNPARPHAAMPAGGRLAFPLDFGFRFTASKIGGTETVACLDSEKDLGFHPIAVPLAGVPDVGNLRDRFSAVAGPNVLLDAFDVTAP